MTIAEPNPDAHRAAYATQAESSGQHRPSEVGMDRNLRSVCQRAWLRLDRVHLQESSPGRTGLGTRRVHVCRGTGSYAETGSAASCTNMSSSHRGGRVTGSPGSSASGPPAGASAAACTLGGPGTGRVTGVALEVSTSTVCRSVLTPPGPGGRPSVGGS
jgi:hypothetical protein